MASGEVKVSPPLDQLHHLRTPLEPGEQRVLDVLMNAAAGTDWEVYIQPHLNGLRPDFVLLNERRGIVVIEVKDWDFEAQSYKVEKGPMEQPRLRVIAAVGGLHYENPVETLWEYYKEIRDNYSFLAAREAPAQQLVTAALVLPTATPAHIDSYIHPLRTKQMLDRNRFPAVDGDRLEAKGIHAIIPSWGAPTNHSLGAITAASFRSFLAEPDVSARQREPLPLSQAQRNIVERRPMTGFRRVKGPAGSGKSVIVAGRAGFLACHGREVLVVSFNITLWHHLRDLTMRWWHTRGRTLSKSWAPPTFDHYHGWVKRVCRDAGLAQEYAALIHQLDDDVPFEVVDQQLQALVSRALSSGRVKKWDAVLVDEGQDFQPEWWALLRESLKDGGEMMLAADATQDLYGLRNRWTDIAMTGAGFRGRWIQLKGSYRIPRNLLEPLRDYAQAFLPEGADLVDSPADDEPNLPYDDCHIRWVSCAEWEVAQVTASEIEALPTRTGGPVLAWADIAFVTPDHDIGLHMLSHLPPSLRVRHVFAPTKAEQRARKFAFWAGDGRIKGSTTHSYKGWESRAVVVALTRSRTLEDLASAYVSLSRVVRHLHGSYLTVVCSDEKLNRWAQEWFETIEPARLDPAPAVPVPF